MDRVTQLLKEAQAKYTDNSPLFLTDFELKVFEHAFRMGYHEGTVDGFKNGVKEIMEND